MTFKGHFQPKLFYDYMKLNYRNLIIFKTFRGPAKHIPCQAFAKTLLVLKLVKPRRGEVFSQSLGRELLCSCRTAHLASWWSNCTLPQFYMSGWGYLPAYTCFGSRCYRFVCICILGTVSVALHVGLACHACVGRA